jgi:hypothetical protein
MNTKTRLIPLALLFVLGSAGAATDSVVAYTIAEGEDIQTIAGTFDVSVEDILVRNGLEFRRITAGATLVIP